MNSSKKALGQVRRLCRMYPKTLTALELVGGVFPLLEQASAINEKIQLLVNQLAREDLERLSRAAHQVLDEHDGLAGAEGFRLGAVAFDPEKGSSRAVFDDRLIPSEFVKELKRVLEKPRSAGSSAAG
jgi:hypothetical protein